MPSRLPQAQIDRIGAQLSAGIPPQAIAKAEGVGNDSVYRIRRNIEAFDSPNGPAISMARRGQPKLLTRAQEEALMEYLLGRPDQYLEE